MANQTSELLLRSIDYPMLAQQKRGLVETKAQLSEVALQDPDDAPRLRQIIEASNLDLLEGLINLLDAIQDHAVDALGLPEALVFPFSESEEDNSPF